MGEVLRGGLINEGLSRDDSRESHLLAAEAIKMLDVLEGLPTEVKESIKEVCIAFLDNYRSGECDCDPSVGINTCNACNARFLLNVDKWGQPLDGRDDTPDVGLTILEEE